MDLIRKRQSNSEDDLILLQYSNSKLRKKTVSLVVNIFLIFGLNLGRLYRNQLRLNGPKESVEYGESSSTNSSIPRRVASFHFWIPKYHLNNSPRNSRISVRQILLALKQIVLIIITGRYAYSTYLLARKDHFSKLIYPRASGYESQCTLFFPTNYTRDRQLYMESRNQLNNVGTYFITNSSTSILYGLIIIYLVSFWLMNAIQIRKRGFIIDVINFVLDPIDERARFKTELVESAISIIRTIQDSNHKYANSLESDVSYLVDRGASTTPINRLSVDNPITLRKRKNSFLGYASDTIDAIKIIIHQNSVKPINLSSRWHRYFRVFMYRIIIATFVTLCIWSLFLISLVIVCQVFQDIKTQIQLTRCLHLVANQSFEHDFLECKTDLTDEQVILYEDQTLYELYKVWKLISLYDWSNCATTRRVIYCIELFLTFLYSTCCAVFFIYLFAINYWDKLYWLGQIEKQVAECCLKIQQLDALNHNKVLSQNDTQKRAQHRNILRQILEVYLNYCLFRRRSSVFRQFNDHISLQVTLVTVFLFFEYYFSSYQTNTTSPLLIINVIITVAFVNLMWLVPAYFFNRILRLRKLIAKLVAIGQESSLNFLLPMELWRNQLLDEHELNSLFAQKTPIGYISYNKMIPLNGYLMAIWIILFRYE